MKRFVGFFRSFLFSFRRGLSSGYKEDSWAAKQIVEMARLGGRLLI
ncbi:MAG: hypothetical protein ABID04_03035 [Patescibacteria group bacterium]